MTIHAEGHSSKNLFLRFLSACVCFAYFEVGLQATHSVKNTVADWPLGGWAYALAYAFFLFKVCPYEYIFWHHIIYCNIMWVRSHSVPVAVNSCSPACAEVTSGPLSEKFAATRPSSTVITSGLSDQASTATSNTYALQSEPNETCIQTSPHRACSPHFQHLINRWQPDVLDKQSQGLNGHWSKHIKAGWQIYSRNCPNISKPWCHPTSLAICLAPTHVPHIDADNTGEPADLRSGSARHQGCPYDLRFRDCRRLRGYLPQSSNQEKGDSDHMVLYGFGMFWGDPIANHLSGISIAAIKLTACASLHTSHFLHTMPKCCAHIPYIPHVSWPKRRKQQQRQR